MRAAPASRNAATIITFSLLCMLTACVDDGADGIAPPGMPASRCTAGDSVAGVPAGVPASPVCGEAVCTMNASCGEVIEVGDDEALAIAASNASSGACIALRRGRYAGVSLPPGVSLLGRSADDVTMQSVSVEGGPGVMLRGFEVVGGGIHLHGAAQIDSVRVLQSSDIGIEVSTTSQVTITRSTVDGVVATGGFPTADGDVAVGIYAFGEAQLAIESVVVANSAGPGILVQGTEADDAACTPTARIDLKGSVIRDNRNIGLGLFAADATLLGVHILDTQPGDTWRYTQDGGGFSVAGCSQVVADELCIQGNRLYGGLIDDSGGTFGLSGAGVRFVENATGVWVQNIREGMSLAIENAEVANNSAVGVGLDGRGGERMGPIVICRTVISHTVETSWPVLVDGEPGGTRQIGDGLVWQGKALALVEELTLIENERASILIDGEVGGNASLGLESVLTNIRLIGEREQEKGIVQQNYPEDGATPRTDGIVPPLRRERGEVFTVPRPPSLVRPF